MPAQEVEQGLAEPARIAHLDHPADVARRRRQEAVEPWQVRRPSRRKLHEHGAQMGPQEAGASEKASDRGTRREEPLHVRPETAELDGEDEPGGGRSAPAGEHARVRGDRSCC